MSLPKLSIKLCVCTEFGPIGPRLLREHPMRLPEAYYPDTPEGRAGAGECIEKMRDYFKRHWKEK